MKFERPPQPFYIRHSATIISGTGLFLFAGVIFIFGSQYIFMRNAHTTKGLVVDFTIPQGKTLKRPVIKFYTPDQKQHTYYHSEGTNPPAYQTGEEVTIYYNPLNAEEVSLGYSFIPMIILSIFGLIFTGIGMAMRR
ncbi:DUF3592 domain-containing protein [Emticicia fontis]